MTNAFRPILSEASSLEPEMTTVAMKESQTEKSESRSPRRQNYVPQAGFLGLFNSKGGTVGSQS